MAQVSECVFGLQQLNAVVVASTSIRNSKKVRKMLEVRVTDVTLLNVH